MKKSVICLLFIFLMAANSIAQECGPNCPVCSGPGTNAGALLSQRTLMISGLSIPAADEETTVINTRYGILSWLDAGLGYAFRTEKVLWNVRAQPVLEKKNGWQPGLIFGTGSVQTGGSDQSIYVQVVKSWDVGTNFGFQLSAGAATLVPDFDEAYGLAGITTSLYKQYAAFANYDGKSFHEGLSWIPSDWFSLSFLLVESEFPAISISFKR